MGGPVIVLEFNELSPQLVEGFMQQGHLPGFSRLHTESNVFITDAEERAPNLEPWIQWVTVHTGLPFNEHKIFDLGDGHKLDCPRLWDLVSQGGRTVWVCGSMNAGARGSINGYILPDAWSTGIEPHPAGEFDKYLHFVRMNVQEYTRDRMPLSRHDALRFAKFMMSRGLSLRSVVRITTQLAGERNGRNRWKRATILDSLQWDMFRWYYKKARPDYATFFLNSTAHFQHYYWRNMNPDVFSVKPSAEEQSQYGAAVLHGYKQMDRIIQDCFDLAGPETTIILCTALSQQPCLTYEGSGGKKIYRALDPKKLLEFAGIAEPTKFAPVMAEQFHLYFENEASAANADEKLRNLKIDAAQAVGVRRQGSELFAGCRINYNVKRDAILESGTGKRIPFYDLFYVVDGTKSGMHHHDGILWIRTPEKVHTVHSERIPLRRVAPTVLSLLGIQKPSFMKMDPLGVNKQTKASHDLEGAVSSD
jgi:hypothetical protein